MEKLSLRKFKKRQLLDDINSVNVVITHLHSDHVGSLSSLIYYCYYVKKLKINIYYPNKDLFSLLRLNGNIGEEINFYFAGNDKLLNVTKNITIQYKLAKHIEYTDCYGIMLKYNFNNYSWNIYYSGDTYEVNRDMLQALITGNIDEFYQDTCLADYAGNVHLSLNKLCNTVAKQYRNKIYCMHLDCRELTNKAKLERFNIVEVC